MVIKNLLKIKNMKQIILIAVLFFLFLEGISQNTFMLSRYLYSYLLHPVVILIFGILGVMSAWAKKIELLKKNENESIISGIPAVFIMFFGFLFTITLIIILGHYNELQLTANVFNNDASRISIWGVLIAVILCALFAANPLFETWWFYYRKLLGFFSKVDLHALETIEKRASLVDSIPYLLSPYYFADLLDREVRRSKRYKNMLAVVCIGMDDGQPAKPGLFDKTGNADELANIAKMLRQKMRESEPLSRIDDSYYLIMLLHLDENTDLMAAARRFKAVINNEENKKHRTCTIAIAAHPGLTDVETGQDLIDQALAAVKQSQEKTEDAIIILDARPERMSESNSQEQLT